MEMLAELRLPVRLHELKGSVGEAGKHLLDGAIAHRRELVPRVLEGPHTVLDPEHGMPQSLGAPCGSSAWADKDPNVSASAPARIGRGRGRGNRSRKRRRGITMRIAELLCLTPS